MGPRHADPCGCIETHGSASPTHATLATHATQALAMACLGAILSSCVPRPEPPDITGPEPPSDLRVDAAPNVPQVFEGTIVTFTATASGGTAPYLFRWDQNDGPVELELAEVEEVTLTIGPLTTPGRYVLRVVTTDADGFHATGYASVEVAASFVAEAPPLAVIGQPVELVATLGEGVDDAILLWEVTSGTAVLDNPTSATPMLTTSQAETVDVRLTLTIPGDDGTPLINMRDFEIVSVADLKPRVVIETNFGDMTLELDGELAPLHTANFLLYVDDGFYDGLLFHRMVTNENPLTGESMRFVLQGGGYERVDDDLVLREPTRDPVPSEADNGLSNGTVNSVALALSNNDPDSGTTQFFFNLDEENSFLDDLGFTVFANLVDGELTLGLIVQVPTQENPVLDGEESLPIVDVIMNRVSRE